VQITAAEELGVELAARITTGLAPCATSSRTRAAAAALYGHEPPIAFDANAFATRR